MNETEESRRKRLDDILKDLKDKIRSKFTVSTFLAGFCFTTLSAQIGIIRQQQELFYLPISIPTLIAATLLFIAAVILLDGLIMPKIFWDRTNGPPDPASKEYGYTVKAEDFNPPWPAPKDLWRLRGLMTFYWSGLTVVAIFLTLVSIALTIVPYYPPFSHENSTNPLTTPQKLELIWDYAPVAFVISILYIAGIYVAAGRKHGKRIWD